MILNGPLLNAVCGSKKNCKNNLKLIYNGHALSYTSTKHTFTYIERMVA